MEELAGSYGIRFFAACYYRQPNKLLATSYLKNLIELNFRHSYSLSVLRAYYRLLKSIQPDILHVHHGVSAFQGAILAKIAGVKTVIKTEHNDHRFYKWYQKILTVPVFFFSHRIICNSQNTLLSFYPWERWIAKNKSKFIYNGINFKNIEAFGSDENRRNVRDKYSFNYNDKLLVSVGRLIPQKNYEILIKGFEEAQKTCRDIKLIIVGGGPQQEKLLQLAEKKGLHNSIKIVGMVQRDEVYRIVNAADFFIIASKWEGFCNAVAEAMAAGKPIISSDIPTLREVIGDQSGFFFNYSSHTDVARAIKETIGSPGPVIEAMGSAAKRRALENFTIETSARSYLDEYVASAKKAKGKGKND